MKIAGRKVAAGPLSEALTGVTQTRKGEPWRWILVNQQSVSNPTLGARRSVRRADRLTGRRTSEN